MENLIDLINKEFQKAGYVSTDHILWCHNMYKDFWVVLDIEGNYNLDEVQDLTYRRLKDERIKEPEIEKNTSLLILNKVKVFEKKIEKVIEEENNEFIFKKYIIQYTNADWGVVKDLIADDSESVGRLIMKPTFFDILKRVPNGGISLLYSIAHKLPFVTMDVTKRDYELSEDLQLSDRSTVMLKWVDSIPKLQKKIPKDEEIEAVKKQIKEIVLNEIKEKDEDRTDSNA